MAHLFGFGHGGKGGGLEWDEILIALFSLLTWFRGGQSPSTDSGDKDEKKIVSFLQAFVSKVDEGIWLSLITQLKKKEQKDAITLLLAKLERFREKDSFRLTVVNAPIATTTIEIPDPGDKDGKKKIKKVVKVGEYSDEDTRVIFLRDIADLVNDPAWGPEKVRDMLRAHELATENKVAERALKFWNGTLAWMNGQVCAFFEVSSLGEITLAKVVGALDTAAGQAAGYVDALADMVPDRPVADMTIGFWRNTFRHHPTQAWILIAGIILTVAFFAIVSPN